MDFGQGESEGEQAGPWTKECRGRWTGLKAVLSNMWGPTDPTNNPDLYYCAAPTCLESGSDTW